MDARMRKLAASLKQIGYTDRLVPEHWNGSWQVRRWFSFDAPDNSILHVITANEYARITLTAPGHFTFRKYVSTKYPTRPKTEFVIDPYGQLETPFEEIVHFVESLATYEQQEAA